MPTPQGWTNSKVKYRDAIVRKLKQEGYSESQAYAIATSMIEKSERKKTS